ncbi:YdbL family protein [Sphingobium rhizovicinum]|uniref:YdbL family protein n=1 Tax=Sphingobium rhizovicinum TaxID=432308 RepID=A0ABV7NFQ0_9SPHN
MTRKMMPKMTWLAAALGLAVGGPVMAQSGAVAAAMSAGTVGEQADGYLGIAGTVGADVRSEVEAINIKRRAAYTQLASQRGVTVQDMAAATACQTLTRLKQGQVYRIGAAAWQTKGAGAIALPSYCATAG